MQASSSPTYCHLTKFVKVDLASRLVASVLVFRTKAVH